MVEWPSIPCTSRRSPVAGVDAVCRVAPEVVEVQSDWQSGLLLPPLPAFVNGVLALDQATVIQQIDEPHIVFSFDGPSDGDELAEPRELPVW